MSRPSELVGRSASASATRPSGDERDEEPMDFEELLSTSEKHVEYDDDEKKGECRDKTCTICFGSGKFPV